MLIFEMVQQVKKCAALGWIMQVHVLSTCNYTVVCYFFSRPKFIIVNQKMNVYVPSCFDDHELTTTDFDEQYFVS